VRTQTCVILVKYCSVGLPNRLLDSQANIAQMLKCASCIEVSCHCRGLLLLFYSLANAKWKPQPTLHPAVPKLNPAYSKAMIVLLLYIFCLTASYLPNFAGGLLLHRLIVVVSILYQISTQIICCCTHLLILLVKMLLRGRAVIQVDCCLMVVIVLIYLV